MSVPAGYQHVLDLFGPDPLAQGEIWFFDPTSEGDATGESPEKALRTAADFNAAKFATGDACVFKVGTVTTLTEKIKNNRAVGREGNPFYIGAYHMMSGKPVHGLGGKARPCIDGLAKGKFDAYGAMNNATLMTMIPKPDATDGEFQEGTLEGLFNWYQSVPYDLFLWVQDLATRYSGGRAFRFSQGNGGRARGLYMLNCYTEGTLKQAIHLTGVYDFIIKSPRITLGGVEFKYWNETGTIRPPGSLASKGTTGDPDTAVNGWFDDPLMWDSYSAEAVNSNSGNRAIAVLDGFAVDCGRYGYYLDRTRDMLVRNSIAIRTDREAFKDFTAGDHGRGSVGFECQDEAHSGSFDWEGTYNTPEDFAKYQTHDQVIENNVAIGYARSFGIQSQAGTKKGYLHEGLPHSAGLYFYGGLSVNPIESHWMIHSGNNDDAYTLDKDNPPRVWACAHLGDAPVADRNESQFSEVFRANYFDVAPPATYGHEAKVGGMKIPVADYEDLSVLMETDEHGWMSEARALAFRDKVRELLRPEACMESSIATDTVTYPEGYTRSEFEAVDMNGKAWGEHMPLGPFADPGGAGEDTLEARVAELEREVADLDERVTDLEAGTQSI